MAPKNATTQGQRDAQAKRNATSNLRSLARRAAIRQLNSLADYVGVKPVSAKTARSSTVEALVRRLEARCQDGALPERLRAVVDSYLANGGTFSVAILPPAPAMDTFLSRN